MALLVASLLGCNASTTFNLPGYLHSQGPLNPKALSAYATNGPYGGRIYTIVRTDRFLFVATANGIYRSADQAASWTYLGEGPSFVIKLVVINSTLFARTTFGMFRSDDGVTWREVSSVGTAHENARYPVISIFAFAGVLIGSSQFNDFYVYDQSKDAWRLVAFGHTTIQGGPTFCIVQ